MTSDLFAKISDQADFCTSKTRIASGLSRLCRRQQGETSRVWKKSKTTFKCPPEK